MEYLKRLGIVAICIPAVILIAFIVFVCAAIYPFEVAFRYIATGKLDDGSTLIERLINYLDD